MELVLNRCLPILLAIVLLAGCACPHGHPANPAAIRKASLRGTRATYCAAVRKPDGRIDVDLLVAQLVDIQANTYSFCIHGAATDWDDLKLFLPLARAHGIRVWGSVVPPSESPPRLKNYAEPFRLDYVKWAEEFAKLSLQETNLVAWSIDDFTHNLTIYTPEYVGKMMSASHHINPRLAFAPCCYYPTLTPAFATNYCSLLDGILFPYRHESAGANLKDPGLVTSEIVKLRSILGPSCPIILDIYASAHSRLGATTAEYVETAMIAGHQSADGVMIYRHQDPEKNADKYQIVKRLFTEWAMEARRPR